MRGTLHFSPANSPPPPHTEILSSSSLLRTKMKAGQKGFSFHINRSPEGKDREPKRYEVLSTWPRAAGLGMYRAANSRKTFLV
jgi:hypothetical protein